MRSFEGRGAPEIDILEVQAGKPYVKWEHIGPKHEGFDKLMSDTPLGAPFIATSLQMAPGRSDRPGNGGYPGPVNADHRNW